MKKFILVLAGLAFSGLAMAGPNWTYVEANYTRADSFGTGSGDDDENDGFNLGGSYGFADKYHINAHYIDGDIGDVGISGISGDYDGFNIGFGVNPAITDNTDFVTNISYTNIDIDDVSAEPDWITGAVGLRSMYTDKVEIAGYLLFSSGSSDIGGDDDFTQISAIVAGQYFVTDNFSVSIKYENDSPLLGDQMQYGVRWSF